MHARATFLSMLLVGLSLASSTHAQVAPDEQAAFAPRPKRPNVNAQASIEAEPAPEALPALEAEAAPDANDIDTNDEANEQAVDAQATDEQGVDEQATTTSDATATPSAQPPVRRSRVDASAPLSGGERWVKENGQWRLRRINYRYLDQADYAPRPALDPGINDFPEPKSNGVSLWTRWFGRPRWGYGYGGYYRPGWSLGWSSGAGWGISIGSGYGGWGYGGSRWGYGGWGYGGSPWSYGVSPWSPYGYGSWRGVPRYGWGNRGGRFRSRFGFSFGF